MPSRTQQANRRVVGGRLIARHAFEVTARPFEQTIVRIRALGTRGHRHGLPRREVHQGARDVERGPHELHVLVRGAVVLSGYGEAMRSAPSRVVGRQAVSLGEGRTGAPDAFVFLDAYVSLARWLLHPINIREKRRRCVCGREFESAWGRFK